MIRYNHKLQENLIYRRPLNITMKLILPHFWDSPKTILDVTAGKRLIWWPGINHPDFEGNIQWRVIFNDKNPERDADYHFDFRWTGLPDDFCDIIVIDVPFVPAENLIDNIHPGISGKNERTFYADGFIEPKLLFEQTVEEFNRIAKEGLVVKIQDRHEDYKLIPSHIHAFNAYSKKFTLVEIIHYRGNRPGFGTMKKWFPDAMVTYYLVFKKNRYRR